MSNRQLAALVAALLFGIVVGALAVVLALFMSGGAL